MAGRGDSHETLQALIPYLERKADRGWRDEIEDDVRRWWQVIGLEGITMRTPDEVGPGWDAALAARRPVVINAYTDPEVPPLPPHITFEQAANYMTALLKGEPHASRTVTQSIKGMAQSYRSKLPGLGGKREA